jgi:hypothetical protein
MQEKKQSFSFYRLKKGKILKFGHRTAVLFPRVVNFEAKFSLKNF